MELNEVDRRILADILYDCFTDYYYLTDKNLSRIGTQSMHKVVTRMGSRWDTIYNALEGATTDQILQFIRGLVKESAANGKSRDIVNYLNTFLREKFGVEINEEGEFFVASGEKEKTSLEIKEITQISERLYVKPIFSSRDIKVEDNHCFVLMPFRDAFIRIFNEHIKPTLEKLGFRVAKADDIFKPGPVIEQIWEFINKSEIIIADVTGRNPNVFYELGIAHTLGKTVIIITQNEDDIPFDLRHLRYFKYSDNEEGWKTLRENLTKIVKTLKE